MRTFAIPFGKYAEVAQLVEHNLAKVGVASSSLVFCSKRGHLRMTLNFENHHPTGFNHMSVVLVHKAAFLFLYQFQKCKEMIIFAYCAKKVPNINPYSDSGDSECLCCVCFSAQRI